MQKFIFFLLISVLTENTFAQLNVDHFKELRMRNIGPAGMSGRITAIDVDLTNPNRIFAGSASGGVWLSENGGTSWKPIFDKEATLAIGSVKINQKNPSEIWVGTGEGNPRNSMNTRLGIYKSIDGGVTWKNMGLKETKTLHRIIIHRDDQNTIFAAALGSPWGPNNERGVFKTTDGGKTWKNVLFVNDLTGASDLVVDPSNPNKMLVSMWEYKREPWNFTSGGKGSGLYVTYEGGESWTKITSEDGLPEGDLGRIGLAIAPGKPNIMYALVEAKENGLYVSKDGGKKWKLVSTKNIGDRPFYYSELYVDPKNENRIYNIYTYVSVSEDGGNTFRNIADYGNNVHPDHHSFWIHPEQPEYLIDGNDGGLNISRDYGTSWYFAGNIPVGQFYHINVDNDFPYNVYGGLQDNGSWVGPGFVLRQGGIRNHDFQEVYFGDGFDVAPYPGDSRYGYTMSQGGNLAFYDRVTGLTSFIQPVHPDPNVKLRFNWNAPLAVDPFNDCGVYYGSQFLHYSRDCGKSWEVLSTDLTTNNKEKQLSYKSGGLTPDATGAENHTTIISIAPSPIDTNIIWTGSDDGQLHITKDRGKTWISVHKNIKGFPEHAWIPQIVASRFQKGEVFVVVNNYRRNDYNPYLFYSNDYGTTWQKMVTNEKISSFVLSLEQDPKEPNLLFLGTDAGLYISFDKGKNWTHWNKNLPAVQISDLKVHPVFGDLIVGTFGRAIWIMDNIAPLRSVAKTGMGMLEKDFYCFESSEIWNTSFNSYDGIRFIGQGEFVGENKMLHKVIRTYGLNQEIKKKKNHLLKKRKKKKKPEKSNKDKIKVEVFDKNRNKIRTFYTKTEGKDGLQVVYWNGRADGVKMPEREKPKEDKGELPSGRKVAPGWYTLHITYNEILDSSKVLVREDPRKEKFWTSGNIDKNQALLDSMIVLLSQKYETLYPVKSTIDLVEKMVMLQPDSIRNEFATLHKRIKTELDSIQYLFFSKENQKGIQRDSELILSKIFTARNYISSPWHNNEENAGFSLQQAIKASEGGMKAIDDFFEKSWKPYITKIDSFDWVLYKDK
ncbi:MAG: hypothetical protein IPK25_16900 [Saprospiraceae bacterium]|nr:hypothetical protein [Saprospiraceae bacterium]